MYHKYFGLDEQAFSIAVNPRYLYMSSQHQEALAHLLYGVQSGGFVMLTGEVGTGKTTIIRCLLEQLPDNADLAVVMNPSASARDLLSSICDEFGVHYAEGETSVKLLTDALAAFLVENHNRGHKSIVLIDEAQLLRISTLEQVRLLTNLETNTQKLLQIILVGQPELNELLAKAALRQLSQRITARYHLRPLSEQEVGPYVQHRLQVAGMPPGQSPFPPHIIHKVFQITGGIPRLINVLCDRMLLGAYSRESTQVDTGIYQQATIEVLGEGAAARHPLLAKWLPQRVPLHWVYWGAAGAALLLVSGLIGVALGSGDPPAEDVAPQVVAIGPILRPPAPTPAPAPAAQPTPTPKAEPWLRDQEAALRNLLALAGLPTTPPPDASGGPFACWVAGEQGYKCETARAATWTELRKTNRPAVLTLTTPARNEAYVTLAALTEDTAWLKTGAELTPMDLDTLGPMWSGEYTFIWRRPPDYSDEAVGLGARGPMVAWVGRQFAQLDGRDKPLAGTYFNAQLRERVRLFQRSQNLADDGLVGMQTLLKLNEALGLERSLTQLESDLLSARIP